MMRRIHFWYPHVPKVAGFFGTSHFVSGHFLQRLSGHGTIRNEFYASFWVRNQFETMSYHRIRRLRSNREINTPGRPRRRKKFYNPSYATAGGFGILEKGLHFHHDDVMLGALHLLYFFWLYFGYTFLMRALCALCVWYLSLKYGKIESAAFFLSSACDSLIDIFDYVGGGFDALSMSPLCPPLLARYFLHRYRT